MKKHNIFKYLTLAVLLIAVTGTAHGQSTRTDYFMQTAYSRNNLNPALRPDQGYLVIPILPNINVGAETNTFNLDHLTFKSGNERVTFMHKSVSDNDFLSGIANDNYLSVDAGIKFFGLGFYKGDAFWNIDLTARVHSDMTLPKSVFELLKKGFDRDGNTHYDLSNIAATGTAFAELAVSYSRPFMNNNLIIGVRPKFLVGFADFDLDAKSLDIKTTINEWQARSQVKLKGAAPGATPTYDEDGLLDGFDFGTFAPVGYGGAIDLGAVYDLGGVVPALKGLKLSAALNDLGFIAWSEKNTLSMSSPETVVIVNTENMDKHNNENTSLSDVLDDAFTDIKDAVNLKEDGTSGGYTKMLRMQMVAGVEYEILQNKLSVGALYTNRLGDYFNTTELTASVNYRPCPWISTSASYSFQHSKYDTFGFALHLAPTKGLNLFLASDYILPHVNSDFVPTTMKGVNAHFGISIPLGGKKSRSKTEIENI